MKRCEASEQMLLIQWCNLNKHIYKGLEMIFHIPNGGTRNKIEASNLKKQGVRAGVPDLFLPVPKGNYNGLFIELKYGKNKATENQKEWIYKLNNQGYLAVICNGFDEAKNIIEKYLTL